MTKSVVITGMGVISAMGSGMEPFWEGLKSGSSGIAPLQSIPTDSLKMCIGAQVRNFSPEASFTPSLLPLLDRFSQFALLAAQEAVENAGLDQNLLASAGAVIGTGCGGKETDEETYHRLYLEGKKRAHPLTIPKGMPSAAASQVSMQFGIQGPVFTVSSACSSSNHAIAQAVLMIRSGIIDVALAGGTDAPFTVGLLKAWDAMRVVSSDTCRPFSNDRSGMVLGEGAGMVVLESEEHARRRGARLHGMVCGIGMSSDAGHITDPSIDGAVRAMSAALEDGGLEPEQVGYVNAHGTGTQLNDVNETAAIRQLFGDHADRLLVSSTKSMHGHALGAAGAMELIATVRGLEEGCIPPTANFTSAGEGCDLDYVPNEARQKEVEVAISNSFAFGGLNASVAVKRIDS
jgi:nodulation protein E